MRRLWTLFAVFALVLSGLAVYQTTAAPIANHAFQTTWERTDQPVASLAVSRTWMWGPEGFTRESKEPYAEAPGGQRTVQYFDKSRMEDNGYRASAPWNVTNGLLVVEMVDGRYQVGDASFDESPEPADVPVGGDPDDSTGPTYRTMGLVRNQPAADDGALITARLARDGTITNDAGTAGYNIHVAQRLTVPGIDHQIAAPFWNFMNSSGLVNVNDELITDKLFENPYYATGYPISEPYWATVKVANVQRDLLVQCFERRCLTYNPANNPAWQVEAGNVGQHYYRWRHTPAVSPTETPTVPASPETPEATSTSTPTPSPTPSPTVTNTPITEPTPSPTPSPTEPPLVLDFWYVNPDQAAYRAIAEQCGCSPSLGNPWVESMMERSFEMRYMYHLVTAPLGQFNADTSGFYPWVAAYIQYLRSPLGGGDPAFGAEMHAHIAEQVRIAVYEPTSPIGIQIRLIEAGLDPLFQSLSHTGTDAYRYFLFVPRFNSFWSTPITHDAAFRRLEQLESDYLRAVYFGGWLDDFGAYLATNGGWLLE